MLPVVPILRSKHGILGHLPCNHIRLTHLLVVLCPECPALLRINSLLCLLPHLLRLVVHFLGKGLGKSGVVLLHIVVVVVGHDIAVGILPGLLTLHLVTDDGLDDTDVFGIADVAFLIFLLGMLIGIHLPDVLHQVVGPAALTLFKVGLLRDVVGL